MRLAAATLLSPPLTVLIVGLAFLGDAILLSAINGIALFFAYSLMAILGLPAHALLIHQNWRNVFVYLGVGAALGFFVGFALSVLIDPEIGYAVEEAGVAGAVCAGLFWLLRRPDRDAPNPPTSAP